jgi:hypothetical protein
MKAIEEPSTNGEAPAEAQPAADVAPAEVEIVPEAPTKEPSSEFEDLLVDDKLLKEEEAAREELRKSADKPRAGGGLTHERLQKLDVLLDQAQMYSKFLTEQVETIQNQIEQVGPVLHNELLIAPLCFRHAIAEFPLLLELSGELYIAKLNTGYVCSAGHDSMLCSPRQMQVPRRKASAKQRGHPTHNPSAPRARPCRLLPQCCPL